MPIPWTFLKALSYPATAIASAGSGALVMYFAKPSVDLEPENKKWSQEMEKLRSEIDAVNQEAQKLEEAGKDQLTTERKKVNETIKSHLDLYSAEVGKYADCLDKLFNKIDKSSSWLAPLYYTDEERLKECGPKPKPAKLE